MRSFRHELTVILYSDNFILIIISDVRYLSYKRVSNVYIFKKNLFDYYLHLMSRGDKVDSILDDMSKENDPQAFSEGLNILCKLTAK